MLPHQDVDVLLGEVDRALRCEVDELSVLRPVVLGVGIPVHCKLLDLEHGEALLLLNLIVDVQKCTYISIVGHRV